MNKPHDRLKGGGKRGGGSVREQKTTSLSLKINVNHRKGKKKKKKNAKENRRSNASEEALKKTRECNSGRGKRRSHELQ